MKSLLLVVLLAAAAAAAAIGDEEGEVIQTTEVFDLGEMAEVAEDAELPEVPAQVAVINRDLSEGALDAARSRLLARTFHSRAAIPNVTHIQDITFRTSGSVRITAIRVIHSGVNQGARASIISGGVGGNFVTVRLQSARGGGYQYFIEVYGQ